MKHSCEISSPVDSVKPYLTSEGSLEDEVEPQLRGLVALYDSDPWRAYHTARHLTEMIDFLMASEDQLREPPAVFGAVLGHDSVYEPWLYSTTGANEKLSRDRTQYFLSPHVSRQTAAKIDTFIEATTHHRTDSKDSDLAYFLDADMHVLGADPERFFEYENDVYREFTWFGALSRKQYLEGRLKFIRSVENKRIFSTELAQDLYEEQAHKNLAALALRHVSELNNI